MRYLLLLCAALVMLQAQLRAGERQFAMGFTPMPHDLSLPAMAEVRTFIAAHADMVAVHLECVPWDEALADRPFAPAMMGEWKSTLSMRPARGKLYLALTPIDLMRQGLAQHRGAKEGEPLSKAFANRTFASPEVQKAYLAYCRRAVEFFQPDYLCIGIEVNELYHNKPAQWPGYVMLHRSTYEALKKEHPQLPIFASFTLTNMLNPAWSDREAMRKAFEQIMPQNDAIAISFYPFMNASLGPTAQALAWVDEEFGRYGKPFAVAETGMSAGPVKYAGHTLPGTPQKQKQFVEDLLSYCQRRKTLFVTWFLYRDYDALWNQIRGSSPELFSLWMRCGLVDAQGTPRPALEVWDQALGAKPAK